MDSEDTWAVLVSRLDGRWQVAELPTVDALDLDLLLAAVHRRPGEVGSFALVDVADEFFVVVRVVMGVERVLLDHKAPPGAPVPGGNASTFDWSILHGWAAPAPWVLAGGLTPGNVANAIRETGAPTVDVSSGVERARGEKDPALIHAFVNAARAGLHATGTTFAR